MLVKNWMSKPAIAVNPAAVLLDAINLLQKHEIHTLPVMEGARLVGIATDRDLKNASAPGSPLPTSPIGADRIFQKKISEIMTLNPVTICEHQTIEDTAELLLVHNISGLPVTNRSKRVVGMITKNDLFRFILTTIGIGKDCMQFAFELIDRPGSIEEVSDIIRDYGGRIGTIFSTRGRAQMGYRQVYIRANDIDRPSLARLKEVLAERVKILYIINHREQVREIYQSKPLLQTRRF
jgi:acetoin utilization protein AcuB